MQKMDAGCTTDMDDIQTTQEKLKRDMAALGSDGNDIEQVMVSHALGLKSAARFASRIHTLQTTSSTGFHPLQEDKLQKIEDTSASITDILMTIER